MPSRSKSNRAKVYRAYCCWYAALGSSSAIVADAAAGSRRQAAFVTLSVERAFHEKASRAKTQNVGNTPYLSSRRAATHRSFCRRPRSRLFFSSPGNKGDSGGNFLGKIMDKAKSVLPFRKSEKEKAELARKKQTESSISGGISELLKDAPLPIRMMGKLVAPALSSMAQEFRDQSQSMSDLKEEALGFLADDSVVRSRLGEPLQTGMTLSQSSSSTSINGVKSTSMRVSFEVLGTIGRGVATMTAEGGEKAAIRQLVLDPGNGSVISIDVNKSIGNFVSGGYSNKSYSKNSGLGKNSRNDEDIIDVEFVEKK